MMFIASEILISIFTTWTQTIFLSSTEIIIFKVVIGERGLLTKVLCLTYTSLCYYNIRFQEPRKIQDCLTSPSSMIQKKHVLPLKD